MRTRTRSSGFLPDLLEPFADDHFGFPATIPQRESGVNVGGVDQIESECDERIEQLERRSLVRRPAEDISAEPRRHYLQAWNHPSYVFSFGIAFATRASVPIKTPANLMLDAFYSMTEERDVGMGQRRLYPERGARNYLVRAILRSNYVCYLE